MVRLLFSIVLSICSISASRLWLCLSIFCSLSSSFCVSACSMLIDTLGFCLKQLSYLFEMCLLLLLARLVLAARLRFSTLYFCLAFLEISFPTCCLSFHLLNSLLNNCIAYLCRSSHLTGALQSLSCLRLETTCLVLSATHFLFFTHILCFILLRRSLAHLDRNFRPACTIPKSLSLLQRLSCPLLKTTCFLALGFDLLRKDLSLTHLGFDLPLLPLILLFYPFGLLFPSSGFLFLTLRIIHYPPGVILLPSDLFLSPECILFLPLRFFLLPTSFEFPMTRLFLFALGLIELCCIKRRPWGIRSCTCLGRPRRRRERS